MTYWSIAVGTALTGGPPRRSQRAEDYRTGLLPRVLASKRATPDGDTRASTTDPGYPACLALPGGGSALTCNSRSDTPVPVTSDMRLSPARALKELPSLTSPRWPRSSISA